MDVGSGGLCSIETHRLVFCFIANYAEHIVEWRDALSGQDCFPLDFINGTFLASSQARLQLL